MARTVVIPFTLMMLAGGKAFALTATTTPTNVMNALYDAAASEGARDLVERVDEALNALNYTIHKMDSDQSWDDEDGIYKVDCSGYVNRMLEDAVPEAYDEVREARDASRLRSSDYYYFFKSIASGGTKGRWRRPAHVADLGPGDLLVWRYKTDPGTGSTGHTTIVVGEAVEDTTRGSHIYRMRVTDAARSGHTRDNRGETGSGVGAGEILVKVDSSGQPISYAWSTTGPFHTDIFMAMGRPRY